MDVIVRRAVELGAVALQPLVSERSARFPTGAHGEKRLAHWRGVAVAACEQCARNRVPVVHEPMPLAAWASARDRSTPGVLVEPDAAPALAALDPPAGALDLLVGPEGGLAPHEVDLSARSGLRPARLGPRILRADTAALTALASVQLLWGDLR